MAQVMICGWRTVSHDRPTSSAPARTRATASAVYCGDVMKLQIQVDDTGKIVDAKFKTFGCGSAIASSSYATTWLKDKTVDEALSIKNTDIANHLNLPPVKLHCSMLAEDAIKAAITDYKKKREGTAAAQH